MKTDQLSRRSRFAEPQPTGKRIVLTPRDIAIFDALDRYGMLPTTYLFELTKHAGGYFKFFQKRLTELYNGYCPHPDHHAQIIDGHRCKPESFIGRDRRQYDGYHAHYQHAVYHLSENGKRALPSGMGARFPFKRSASFVHDLMASCITASFELSTPGFIFRDGLLKNAPATTLASKTPFLIDGVQPDDLFAVELEGGGYRFLALEADRATERVNTKQDVKQSIERKIERYCRVLDLKLHECLLGIPKLTVLFATTNAIHMQTMLAHVRERVEPRFQSRFLFKTFPTFGEGWRVPAELLPVCEPWKSVKGEVDLTKR